MNDDIREQFEVMVEVMANSARSRLSAMVTANLYIMSALFGVVLLNATTAVTTFVMVAGCVASIYTKVVAKRIATRVIIRLFTMSFLFPAINSDKFKSAGSSIFIGAELIGFAMWSTLAAVVVLTVARFVDASTPVVGGFALLFTCLFACIVRFSTVVSSKIVNDVEVVVNAIKLGTIGGDRQ